MTTMKTGIPNPLTRMKSKQLRWLCCALILCLLTGFLPSAHALTLQDCHRVTLTDEDTVQGNGSVIRFWHVDTVLDSVDQEIAGLEQEFVDQIAPTLQKAKNKTSMNSRLDMEVRYSRTGLSWMSFVLQARITYHRDLIGQELTTRTYDMLTGDRITMSDLFPEDSPAWITLSDAVRSQLTDYFPDETPDEATLDHLCAKETLQQADFSLHGYSLVLHYPAFLLYPEHPTLMEVTVMYSLLQEYMTEEARKQTDNLAYYKTCALTFDDGPSRTNTTLVLKNLMIQGARATFFVVGNRIDSYVDQVQREHDQGHAIGMHNWHHGNVNKSSAASLRGMVAKCDAKLIKAIGIPSRYDRVPYGLYPKMIKSKVGWSYIQWSVDTYDWRGRSSSSVLSSVKKKIADGDIILCHDIKDNTPESTLRICDYLAENGYILLTIDELFAKDGVELQPDTVYWHCADGETGLISK